MPTLLLSPGSTAVAAALGDQCRSEGWTVTSGLDTAAGTVLDAVAYDPGLFDGTPRLDAVTDLLAQAARWRLRPRADGGAAVVVIGGREQLGSSEYPGAAAVAGGLASAVRSLALRLAPDNTTVNLIAAAAPADQSVPGLLPDPVTAQDVASTARFLRRGQPALKSVCVR